MKHPFFWRGLCTGLLLGFLLAVSGQPAMLSETYDLSRPKSKEVQSYTMESRLLNYAPDGTRKDSDVYRLSLICKPGTAAGGDTFTCVRFTVQMGSKVPVAIPALAGFRYVVPQTPGGTDENGQLFGIPHKPFEKLIDSSGKDVPFDKAYHVYNAFVDFHSMSVFADKPPTGKGVQDLKHIGDQVVHSASYSEPPVHLGAQVKKGSVFRNGEITLLFKGIGVGNGRACALLGYDSGQSSFIMITEALSSVEFRTVGSSHYYGDICKDLSSGWIQQADLKELVVSETVITGQTLKIHSVIERNIRINNVPL
jgi:hypothetical protein